MSDPFDDKIIAQLGIAHQALAHARTIEDFKLIADASAAAGVYARRLKLSSESVKFALEIKLRAERGLGEVLSQTPKRTGRLMRGSVIPAKSNGDPSTLDELGLTKHYSRQTQQLAAIPSETFEAKIAAGERRLFAFIRTSKTPGANPLDSFIQTLRPLGKHPNHHYANLASSIQKEAEARDLYNKCLDVRDKISLTMEVLEVRFPNLKEP